METSPWIEGGVDSGSGGGSVGVKEDITLASVDGCRLKSQVEPSDWLSLTLKGFSAEGKKEKVKKCKLSWSYKGTVPVLLNQRLFGPRSFQ